MSVRKLALVIRIGKLYIMLFEWPHFSERKCGAIFVLYRAYWNDEKLLSGYTKNPIALLDVNTDNKMFRNYKHVTNAQKLSQNF